MAFDLGKIQNITSGIAELGAEKAQEILNEISVALTGLQSAGYQIGDVDVELGLPPAVNIELKMTGGVSEEKLNSIVRENKDRKIVSTVLLAVIEANRLRSGISLDTLSLQGMKIRWDKLPTITLQWKEKAAKAVAA